MVTIGGSLKKDILSGGAGAAEDPQAGTGGGVWQCRCRVLHPWDTASPEPPPFWPSFARLRWDPGGQADPSPGGNPGAPGPGRGSCNLEATSAVAQHLGPGGAGRMQRLGCRLSAGHPPAGPRRPAGWMSREMLGWVLPGDSGPGSEGAPGHARAHRCPGATLPPAPSIGRTAQRVCGDREGTGPRAPRVTPRAPRLGHSATDWPTGPQNKSLVW